MIKNCNIVGCAVNSTIAVNNPYDEDKVSTRLVLDDMLAAIAAECIQADEAEKQSRLENFYAGML